jgi:hypothetical protein
MSSVRSIVNIQYLLAAKDAETSVRVFYLPVHKLDKNLEEQNFFYSRDLQKGERFSSSALAAVLQHVFKYS